MIGFLGGIKVCLMFLPMLKHIFHGYKGRDTLNNLKQFRYIYLSNIQFFYKIIKRYICKSLIIFILVLIYINLFLEINKI